jgi:hypothetical protein
MVRQERHVLQPLAQGRHPIFDHLEAEEQVAAEIERGIKLVTRLSFIPSKTPGWVGVRCDSEEMAIWLLRAIIVENVMVQREGRSSTCPPVRILR